MGIIRTYAGSVSFERLLGSIIDSLAGIYSSCPKKHGGYIGKICRRIENQPTKPLLLKEISKDCGISCYHMMREFKKSVGLAPYKFLIRKRIRFSQKMLDNGCSVAQTALDAGFGDQSHYMKHFKNIVRITPLEYIRSVRNV